MKLLNVVFHNPKKQKTIKIENEKYYDLEDVQYKPQIKFNIPANKYYTILMVDPDAPSPDDNYYKHWLHWMIINNNETVIDFKPSSPPPGKPHRYYIYLMEQLNKLDLKSHLINKREKFPLDKFISDNKLKLLAGVMYQTEKKVNLDK
jgi:phosphatidylethanolamine-binding protein (PEBP) family uncharacterized protein